MASFFGTKFDDFLVKVPAARNPAVGRLSDEHDRILRNFDQLNRRIVGYRVGREPGRSVASEIASLRAQVSEVETEMLQWESEVRQFMQMPTIDVEIDHGDQPEPPLERTQAAARYMESHLLRTFEMIRNDMQMSRLTLLSNQRQLDQSLITARSFKKADDSVALGGWGLLLALFSIAISLALSSNGCALP